MTNRSNQLAVIGGGPGGYAAAFLAADLGLDVALIDPEDNPGGVCLYRGCIPSKALLHVARLIAETDDARHWGVNFGKPEIDLDQLRQWKDGVIAKLTGGLGQLVDQRKITHLKGMAQFNSNRSLTVMGAESESVELTFEHAIIATGSHPLNLPIFDLDSDRVMDATAALKLDDIPKKMLVVGGGYIGLELGTVYAALGSKVTVVEMLPQLLAGVDRDLVAILAKRLQKTIPDIRLETVVEDVKLQKNGLRATLRDKSGDTRSQVFDKVLLAVGRRPNSTGLGLSQTGVIRDDNGFIQVDSQRRTNDPQLFAIGDVAGEPMLAHKAAHEARVAVEAIVGRKVAYEPAAVPAVVFTDPEIAWTGLTATEAKKMGIDHKVVRFPWAASGRALTLGRSDGLTKMVIDTKSERVLGVGIVGPGAGEMIAEGVLAMEMAANVTDIGLSIHPHPTLSETFKEAAEIYHGTATHVYRPKR